MAYRALMVMRMKPENTDAVAELFAEHDKGDMPRAVGLSRRTLFRFHDLYMHVLEAETDMMDKLYEARNRPDFRSINSALDTQLQRYDPQSWRELKDSMALPFYSWSADD